MRLDLYLKMSRLIKRRAVAREMCESGRVLVNGHEARPAKEVRPGDIITVKFSARVLELEVTGVLDESSKKGAPPPEGLYQVKAETRVPKEKDLWSENPS